MKRLMLIAASLMMLMLTGCEEGNDLLPDMFQNGFEIIQNQTVTLVNCDVTIQGEPTTYNGVNIDLECSLDDKTLTFDIDLGDGDNLKLGPFTQSYLLKVYLDKAHTSYEYMMVKANDYASDGDYYSYYYALAKYNGDKWAVSCYTVGQKIE